MTRSKRLLSISLMVLLLVGAGAAWLVTATTNQRVNTNLFGVAIQGYDTVAYFTQGEARKGSAAYEVEWEDARWQFATAEHRDLFAAAPERYVPQYGGFCASYLAAGGMAGADPQAWVIIAGKLYLNWSKEGSESLVAGGEDAVRKADRNWAERRAKL